MKGIQKCVAFERTGSRVMTNGSMLTVYAAVPIDDVVVRLVLGFKIDELAHVWSVPAEVFSGGECDAQGMALQADLHRAKLRIFRSHPRAFLPFCDWLEKIDTREDERLARLEPVVESVLDAVRDGAFDDFCNARFAEGWSQLAAETVAIQVNRMQRNVYRGYPDGPLSVRFKLYRLQSKRDWYDMVLDEADPGPFELSANEFEELTGAKGGAA